MATLEHEIRRYASISAAIDILRRKELVLLDPNNWDDRNELRSKISDSNAQ